MPDQSQRSAAYVPWGTFRNSIDRLSEGLPHQVDPSVFPTYAGGTRTQLIAALKFLSLIDEDNGTPTDMLRELVQKNELERKPILKRVLREAYSDLISLNLEKATLDQVSDVMEQSYGVSGTTRTKAVRFFLHGAKEVGIKLSPYLEKAKPSAGSRTRTKRKNQSKSKKAQTAPPATTEESKTVKLASGGELTLSANLTFFSLSSEDRKFVFGLISQMEDYEITPDEDDDNGNGEEEEVLEDEGRADQE